MFILNRLRGTWSWFAKVNGVVLGLLFYLFTSDLYTAIALSIAYVIGESMGWGKWIGGIINETTKADAAVVSDEEGRRNGIHWIANKIYPETDDYQSYCILALTIRGMYWFLLMLLPLVVAGYIPIMWYLIMSLLLGLGFPASVFMGKETTKYFNFESKYFNVNGAWEHAEVWYGLMQDIILIILLISLKM